MIEELFNCVEELFESSEQEIIDAYKNVQGIKDKLLKLSTDIPSKHKLCMQEFYIAAHGIMLLQSLVLLIKKYDLNQEIEVLMHEPMELAQQLEYWLVDFSKLWRMRNKESELFRIREVVIGICGFLRKIK